MKYTALLKIGSRFIKTLDWSSTMQGMTRQIDRELVPKSIGSKPHSTN